MFKITPEQFIYINRGDIASFLVDATKLDGQPYTFKVGDIVRIKVTEKKKSTDVVLSKDFEVTEESQTVTISLRKEDTTIGEVISKPKDYWYEIELNPDTLPQTIIGYDDNGAKLFRLFPEGGGVDGM